MQESVGGVSPAHRLRAGRHALRFRDARRSLGAADRRRHGLRRSALTGLGLYMVGVIVRDMPRAVEFYRRLGVHLPSGAEDAEHVEVPMGGVTFFLNTERSNAKWDPARSDASGGYRIILEFYLETREALDAKYAEMIGYGYEVHVAPYDVTSDLRFAMINDVDGNTILLSAATGDLDSD